MARDVALIYVIASILFCAGTTMIISMVPRERRWTSPDGGSPALSALVGVVRSVGIAGATVLAQWRPLGNGPPVKI